ncbi:MAG: hypothetical protein AB7I36_20460 [Rhodospirillaceae bacterium]
MRNFDLMLQLVSPRCQAEHFFLPLGRRHNVIEHQVEQLLPARLDLGQFPLGRVEAGALLHPQAVHLFRELAAELFEEVFA